MLRSKFLKFCFFVINFSMVGSSYMWAGEYKSPNSYLVKDLGTTLADGSRALSINNKGQVAGIAVFSGKDFLFFWDPKIGLTLVDIPYEYYCSAISFSAPEGYVTVSESTKSIYHNSMHLTEDAVVYFNLQVQQMCIKKGSGSSQHNLAQYVPLIWSKKRGFQSVNVPGGVPRIIYSANDSGKAIIDVITNSGGIEYMLYDKGCTERIDGLSAAQCINQKNEILGIKNITSNGKNIRVPCVLLPNGKILLADGVDFAFPNLNDKCEAIISQLTVDGRRFFKYNFKTKEKKLLGIFEPKLHGQPILSNKNEILLPKSVAPRIINTKGKVLNINGLLNLHNNSNTAWTQITDCLDINDTGQLVGYGIINGRYHAVLLTPVR